MNSVLSELRFGVHQTAGTVIQTVDPYPLVYLNGWWVRKEFCWFEVVGRLGALMCVLVEHTPFLFRLHAGLSLCACSMSRLYNAQLVSLAVPWLDPLVLACHVTQAFDRACSLSSTLTLLGSSLTWFLHSSTFRTVWFLQYFVSPGDFLHIYSWVEFFLALWSWVALSHCSALLCNLPFYLPSFGGHAGQNINVSWLLSSLFLPHPLLFLSFLCWGTLSGAILLQSSVPVFQSRLHDV